MAETALLIMGRITGVHGLKGYLKVKSYAASHDSFQSGGTLFVGTSPERAEPYSIARVAPHKKGLLLMLDGVAVDRAETLVGRDLFMSKTDLPALEDDTYYWDDLMGMAVTDVHRGELGTVFQIMPTGSNDVLVVRQGARETLVPFLSHVVLSVDMDLKQIVVDLPEGL